MRGTSGLVEASRILQLLLGAEALGRLRGREEAYREATGCVLRFLGARHALLYKVAADREGLQVHPLGWRIADDGEDFWLSGDAMLPSFDPGALLLECYGAAEGRCLHCDQGDWTVVFAIGPHLRANWLLEIHADMRPSDLELEAVASFLRCFRNQQELWDYANLDTLTRLLNRKTFEESFDRLIDRAANAQYERLMSRGPVELTRPCWLGVIDIDHFKRINDGYGHLFGDEVLLRIANLMRNSFRASDRLFRFGGEEFVAMIHHAEDEVIAAIFDRFRQAVEAHQFPQIGQVTCSIGFTRIDPSRLPAELLGQADEALYYSKESGRNRTSQYEVLIAQGLIHAQENISAAHQAEADIFFD
ncbi:MAG: GGDEF domain-containing protein [Rhodocyclaceae bacterium]|nr:GGDEF domain-containing protein [Rhodocyclaceae bacterium]